MLLLPLPDIALVQPQLLPRDRCSAGSGSVGTISNLPWSTHLQVVWGHHSVMEAMRLLLVATAGQPALIIKVSTCQHHGAVIPTRWSGGTTA